MTSSLVGSEMCIRDRRQQAAALRESLLQQERDNRALREAAESAIKAVSYTHLTLPTICSV
eukprot:1865888-Prorocentrum_lima.AAC.1